MARSITKLPGDLAWSGMNAIRTLTHNVRRRMSVEGQPVKYPIPWDSPRQKRFVLRMLARKGELPYKRKGKYRMGWRSEGIPFGIRLMNAHPAGAIGGTPFGWQSKVTRGRWPFFLQVLFEELQKFPETLSHELSVVGNEPK